MRRRVVALFTCSSTSTSTSTSTTRLILAECGSSNKLIRTTNTRIRMMGNSSSRSSSSSNSSSSSSITADGTRMFFDWLEKKYGARYGGKPLPMMMMANTDTDTNSTDNTQSQSQSQEEEEKEIDDVDDDSAAVVLTRNSLELNDIKKLFSHQIVALKIKNFYPSNYAIELGKELAKEGLNNNTNNNTNNNANNNANGNNGNGMKNWKISTSKGLESSDVFTLGRHSPYNIAIANNGNNGNGNGEQEYFNEVRNELRDRRGLTLLNNNGNDDGNGNDDDNDGNDLQQQNQKKEEKLQQKQKQPRLWPLDLLRLELDEIWPYGAGLARRQRRSGTGTGNNSDSDSDSNIDCMGGGLPRLMIGPTRWKKGLVHVDELAPLTLNKGCFSANIYLQLPYSSVYAQKINDDEEEEQEEQEQPVMEIWPLQIQSKWDWFRNATTLSHLTSQDPEGQVILRKVLNGNNNDNKNDNKNKNKSNNKYTINVHPGDLILLCVQRPHCAIGFGHHNNDNNNDNNDNSDNSDGDNNNNVNTKNNAVVMQTRVSLQCFLQYNGSKERLTIDS